MVQISELRERLGLHASTLQKQGYSLTGTMSKDEAENYLSKRTKASGRWTVGQAAEAAKMLAEITGESVPETSKPEIVERKPKAEMKTKAKTKQETKQIESVISIVARFVSGNDALFLTVIIGFVAQTLHTFRFATLCLGGAFAESLFIALAVDLTALTLTIRTRNAWYLVAFAAVHSLLNLTYYYNTTSLDFPRGLLSVVVAFANFAYSELFTKGK
jgi:hypothetical protein